MNLYFKGSSINLTIKKTKSFLRGERLEVTFDSDFSPLQYYYIKKVEAKELLETIVAECERIETYFNNQEKKYKNEREKELKKFKSIINTSYVKNNLVKGQDFDNITQTEWNSCIRFYDENDKFLCLLKKSYSKYITLELPWKDNKFTSLNKTSYLLTEEQLRDLFDLLVKRRK